MPVRIGNSYVSEAAAQFAKAVKETKNVKESEGKAGGKGSSVLNDLAKKFPKLRITVGTQPFSGSGLSNLSISPKILREMEKDPEKRMEYEALIYDVANYEVPKEMAGRTMKSHGFIIGNDGGLRSWGISTTDNGLRRSQSSVKRSDKKKWWQQLLDAPKKKKASSTKALQEKMLEKAREKNAEKAGHREDTGFQGMNGSVVLAARPMPVRLQGTGIGER